MIIARRAEPSQLAVPSCLRVFLCIKGSYAQDGHPSLSIHGTDFKRTELKSRFPEDPRARKPGVFRQSLQTIKD
jgi:hypothetical protein